MSPNKDNQIVSHFLRLSLVSYLLNYLGSALNYLFHFLSGSRLSLVNLGNFESIFSLFSLFGIIINGLSFSLIEYYSNFPHIGPSMVRTYFKYSIFLAIFLLFLYLPINSFIKFNQPIAYTILVLVMILNLFSILYTTFIHSKYQILTLSLIGITTSISRAAIMYLTLNPYVSILVSTALGLVVAIIFANKLNSKISASPPKYSFSISTFTTIISSILLNLFIVQDIVLVKHYFSSATTGAYVAASIIGKILLFATTPILVITIPMIIQSISKKNKIRIILGVTFASTFFIGITILILFSLFQNLLLRIFFQGQNFTLSATILSPYLLLIFLYTIYNVLIQIFISLKHVAASQITGLVTMLQLILIVTHHQSLLQLINSSTISIIVGITVSMLIIFFDYLRPPKAEQ